MKNCIVKIMNNVFEKMTKVGYPVISFKTNPNMYRVIFLQGKK